MNAQWRWMKRFFILWPFWCSLIIGINIWHDASNGLPFDWHEFLIGIGIALFGGVVFILSRMIFEIVRDVTDKTDRP